MTHPHGLNGVVTEAVPPAEDMLESWFAYEHHRTFRRLLTPRLGALALIGIGASMLHLVPSVAAWITVTLVAAALMWAGISERTARTRLRRSVADADIDSSKPPA